MTTDDILYILIAFMAIVLVTGPADFEQEKLIEKSICETQKPRPEWCKGMTK